MHMYLLQTIETLMSLMYCQSFCLWVDPSVPSVRDIPKRLLVTVSFDNVYILFRLIGLKGTI